MTDLPAACPSDSGFVSLNAGKNALHRAILGIRVAERARIVLSRHPAEVPSALDTLPVSEASELKSPLAAEAGPTRTSMALSASVGRA